MYQVLIRPFLPHTAEAGMPQRQAADARQAAE
jgi:hypothetical protein